MIELYSSNITSLTNSNDCMKMFAFLSKSERDRVLAIRSPNDMKRSLVGNFLARYIACKKLHVTNDQIIVTKNDYGKPLLQNYPDLHYNISHSGDWVVCAVSLQAIGIDIELRRQLNPILIQRFLSKGDFELIRKQSDTEKLNTFYKIWTVKESYIKYLGLGLSMPMNSFTIRVKDSKFYIGNRDIIFTNINYDKDYSLSICSKEPIRNADIQELSLNSIDLHHLSRC